MKILIVTDKVGSAIWRLAQGVQKYNPHIQIDVIAVHPKRPDIDQLNEFVEKVEKADIISFEYWKTYITLRESYPELMNKPKMLAHYNPYNTFEEEWREFDIITVPNKTIQDMLRKRSVMRYVPLTIDLEKFPFSREYTDSNTVLMVSGRIEGKKGVLPVAEACKELGYKMLLVGSISKKDYFDEVMKTGVVEFRQSVSDDELLRAYQESAIHVCNSIDSYESGTLCILEAMSVGCPVLTRNVGHVPDISTGTNMVVRKGGPEDLEDLKTELKNLMDNPIKRKEIRDEAWNSAKVRDDVRRAREYEKIWHSMLSNKPLVSVIIPTFNRKEILAKVIESVFKQTYPALEIVVCDDGSTDGTREFIQSIQKRSLIPIKYVNTETPNEYNLAYAKNLGVIELIGEALVFCDDRYAMDREAIEKFMSKLHSKKWLFGDKGTGKRNFVENFGCIYRQEFIDGGMFNQSCKLYGFQSQELRERYKRQGFKFDYVEAKAEILISSKNRYKKRDEIRKAKNVLYKLGL